MSKAPLVTVLIPFYNRKRYISDTLLSLQRQTFKRWQAFLLDDASTEDAITILRPYLRDKRIRLFRSKVNVGKSKILNEGLKKVRTPFVLELDSDDWLTSNAIASLLKRAQTESEDVGVVSANINLVKGNIHRWRVVSRRRGRAFSDPYKFLMANRVVWPRFYRSSALRRVNGWPTDDPYEGRHGIDDLRVLLRLIEHYRFTWINQNLYMYRLHPNSLSSNRKLLADAKEWVVRDTLVRWGDEFSPVFTTDDEGWKYVTELIPNE